MALRRFWVPDSCVQTNAVLLTGELFHHAKDVCRFSVGDRFEILKGDGLAYLVQVVRMDSRALHAQILEQRLLPELSRPHIHLCLSLPKYNKMDWIVEKSVELGVKSIKPFVSDYSFVRAIKDVSTSKQQRWQKLVTAATQQSGRGDLLQIAPATSLRELLNILNRAPHVFGLFPFEGAASIHVKQALQGKNLHQFSDLWVFVGSEGGFSPSEVDLFKAHKLEPVTLGEQILRVETACVALVSIIKYELNQM